jgi:hypothetical protein
MNELFPPMTKGAEISADGKYRYVLWRRWDKTRPRLIFVMLNPSTADAEHDDATIRVCMGRARRGGYGGIRVLNLFAFRATDPSELKTCADPVGPENDHFIERYLALRPFGEKTIAAWGDGGLMRGIRRPRWSEVVDLICGDMGDDLYHLGLTKAAQPRHPLRVPYTTAPELWLYREIWYGLCRAARGEQS